MIATTPDYAAFGYTAAGVLLCAAGVLLGWLVFTIRGSRRRPVVERHVVHTAYICGAGGDTVEGHWVSNDGHLYGLCPGCGKTNVSCSIIDRHLPFGPWAIDDHEPRIDPEFGLHGGECWANKSRTEDYGLCICGRVEEGLF